MKSPPNLHELVRCCTVKLGATGGTGYGTGFFVAPGLILTCFHVVEGMRGKQINALWQQQDYATMIEQLPEDPQKVDLALLRLEDSVPAHPCVLLDDSIESRDFLYFYGYSDYHSNGDPVTVDCEGITGDEPPLVKFKAGQVRPGLSGSPLLNERTGKVCGIIKFTRSRGSDLGGGAVPTSVILSQFKALTKLQQAFHQQDSRWMESTRQMILCEGKTLRSTGHGDVVHPVSQQPSLKSCHPVFKLHNSSPVLLDRQQECSNALVALKNRQSAEVYSQQGWGKTTLLESLADRCQSEALFPDGIVYPPLCERQFVEDLLQLLFDLLYESDLRVKATEGQIQRYLQNRKALIVLDDVQLTKDQLKKLRQAMPGCTFLLAELERQLLGENVHALKLRGLPLPDAIELMERGLGRALTDAEHSAAQSLWTTLQGHPARILQAVGMVNEQRSLASIVHQTQFETLTQQILASLQKHQQWIIAALAALGGVALLAKQAVALTGIPDAEPVLKTLVQRHLVQIDGPRYRLASNLVEDLQQLDLNPWRERALDYFTTWAEQRRGALPHLLEQDAILKVLDWAVMQGRWREVLSLVQLVEGALMVSGQWSAWEQVLQWGLQAAQAVGDLLTEAWALHQLGTRALCLENNHTAGNFLDQALRQREFLGDEMGAAVTRHNLNLIPVPVPPRQPDDPEPPSRRLVSPKLLWFAGIFSTLLLAAGGWSIWKWISSPQPPTDFSVVPVSQTEVALTWKDNSDNETGFRIERQGTGGEFKKISQVKADETASKEGSLSPNSTYTYRVGAIGQNGRLSYSEEKKVRLPPGPVPPPEPSELSARAVSQSRIDLEWIDKSAGSSQFKIERSTDGGKTFNQTAVVPAGKAIYADKQLQANTTYHYRMRATNAVGDSEYSNIVNATTPLFPIPPLPSPSPPPTSLSPSPPSPSPSPEDNVTTSPPPSSNSGDNPTTLPSPSPPPPPPNPRLTVSPSRLNFGGLLVGDSSQEQSVTLTNKGNVPIKILNIKRIGDHQSDFFITANTCPDNRLLLLEKKCEISISFRPTGTNVRRASLVISHNAVDESKGVSLKGIGKLAPVEITEFFAKPPQILPSQRTQLCYGVINAVSASIEGIGLVKPVGRNCISIAPKQTITYTLVATGHDRRQVRQQIIVEVTQPRKSTTFEVGPW